MQCLSELVTVAMFVTLFHFGQTIIFSHILSTFLIELIKENNLNLSHWNRRTWKTISFLVLVKVNVLKIYVEFLLKHMRKQASVQVTVSTSDFISPSVNEISFLQISIKGVLGFQYFCKIHSWLWQPMIHFFYSLNLIYLFLNYLALL